MAWKWKETHKKTDLLVTEVLWNFQSIADSCIDSVDLRIWILHCVLFNFHSDWFSNYDQIHRETLSDHGRFFFLLSPYNIHVNLIRLGKIWQQRACTYTYIVQGVCVGHRSSICYIRPYVGISGDAIQLWLTRLHESTHTNSNALKWYIATVHFFFCSSILVLRLSCFLHWFFVTTT